MVAQMSEQQEVAVRAGYITLMRVWVDQHKGGLLVTYSLIGAIYSMWVLINLNSPIMLGLQMFTLGAVLTLAMQYMRNRE
jgi:hypothetical protein